VAEEGVANFLATKTGALFEVAPPKVGGRAHSGGPETLYVVVRLCVRSLRHFANGNQNDYKLNTTTVDKFAAARNWDGSTQSGELDRTAVFDALVLKRCLAPQKFGALKKNK